MSRSEDEAVIELAKKVDRFFEVRKRRDDDEKSEFVTLKDNAPEWLSELVHTAHGDMGPDDHRYEFISQAIDAIAEGSPGDLDGPEIEPDIYNHDLLAWLSSRNDRASYVDEAIEEYGQHSDMGIMGDIGIGQLREREEVYHSVLQSLRNQVEGDEDDED